MAYRFLANASDQCNGELLQNIATIDQRTVATVEFVEDECQIPSMVDIDEVFTLKVVYRLASIERRNYEGILDHFSPVYDGGFYKIYYEMLVPYMAWWIWNFTHLELYSQQGGVWNLKRTHFNPSPQKHTWTFTGTITQLLGYTPTEDGYYDAKWRITGKAGGAHDPADYWPYNYVQQCGWNNVPCDGICEYGVQIYVNMTPTSPHPLFNVDGCALPEESVLPDEQFGIKVSVKNANQYSGSYRLTCYCRTYAHEITLKTGTIGGGQTITQTFNVTANDLAGTPITETKYVEIEVRVFNEATRTDVWPAGQIAVVVTTPDTASLSGKVTDIMTAQELGGVAVEIDPGNLTQATDSQGIYRFENLEPGTYEVLFYKAGYWDVVESKNLLPGPNSLNIALTPTSEPPPVKPIPWGWIAAGGVAAAVVAVIASKKKKEGKR